ncbi:MAG: FAD-binding oxidoreductase [Lentisphaerae bacterium RIFOXYA12_FULL_48_11]|nr:MAG: FAD-binding oxidoreductase [Lentisphaerae bacterium RIFOXYA12_FULL_48_11]
MSSDYADYLRDESRRVGKAESISFPKSEIELADQLSLLNGRNILVTIQGARTGITSGAVPDGGHIINLSRLNRITGISRHPSKDAYILTVQPGLLLSELSTILKERKFDTNGWTPESMTTLEEFKSKGKYFFTPDPTETSASTGGIVSCNASGARSFFFGATRPYVESLRIVLADGSVIALKRNTVMASGKTFAIKTENGREIRGNIPAYQMPMVKNAAGYFAMDNMDLIDLFIGSEGTLGVFSEIGVTIIPMPAVIWGIMAFFPSEETAIKFVTAVRTAGARPTAVEFFNHGALDLLRKQKECNPAFSQIPSIAREFHTAIYVEYQGNDEETVENAVMNMSEIMVASGGSEDATWLASEEAKLSQLKQFRHAVPEAVNLLIDERRKKEPALTKLGTDLSVPDEKLADVMKMYNTDLTEAGLEYAIFGHIGDNHVHVNIIPNSMDDYHRGKKLYLKWAEWVVAAGGSVSAEHGIGKLKVEMLKTMYGDNGIQQMKELRQCFDSSNILSRGNLFI